MIIGIDDAIEWLRAFHRGLHPSPGIDSAAIPGDLPYGLSCIYRELGNLIEMGADAASNRRAPFRTQDALMPLSALKRVDGMIEFAWENQGNWSARCLAGQADPPVYTNAGDGGGGSPFERVCDSLNAFLITLCLQEAVMSAPVVYFIHGPPGSDALRSPLQALWLDGPCAVRDCRVSFFHLPERDVIVMGDGPAWVASHSPEAIWLINPKWEKQLILG